MAFNVNQIKNALTGATKMYIPPGWYHDNIMNRYYNDAGLYVSDFDVTIYGSLLDAIVSIHGSQAISNNSVPTNHISQAAQPYASMGPMSVTSTGSLSIADVKPTNVIQIETKVGRVGINTETGDITIPPGIGRDEAIREFWFGFQKHFNPFDKAKYEVEIKTLKDKLEQTETAAEEYKSYAMRTAIAIVAARVRKKYGNEKFIMVKPEDLIKFIEEA